MGLKGFEPSYVQSASPSTYSQNEYTKVANTYVGVTILGSSFPKYDCIQQKIVLTEIVLIFSNPTKAVQVRVY